MTVNTTANSVEYPGNGVSDEFAYSWKIFHKSHLTVTLVEADGTRTAQVVDTDYTVTGVGASAGGNVVLTTPHAIGETLVIELEVPLTQPADFKNQGDYYPERHEDAFDRTNMQIRQIDRKLQASLRIPAGSDDYDAGGVKIVDLADGEDATDAATLGQLDETFQTVLSGVAGSSVAFASGTGDGSNVNLSFPGITVTVAASYLLVVGGVLQLPGTDYTADPSNDRLIATTAPGNGVPWFAICIGYERAINILSAGSIDTAQLVDGAVTLAKMDDLPADTIIGRQTASTGVPEQITCTAAGRAVIGAANAAAQRTALGLGSLSTLSEVGQSNLSSALQAVIPKVSCQVDFSNTSIFSVSAVAFPNATTCRLTIGAHWLAVGDKVYVDFPGSGTRPADGQYTVTAVAATTFDFTVASGSYDTTSASSHEIKALMVLSTASGVTSSTLTATTAAIGFAAFTSTSYGVLGISPANITAKTTTGITVNSDAALMLMGALA